MRTPLLPERFDQPLTQFTLTELKAHDAMLQLEVERVARVCDYWQRNVLKPKTNVRRFRGVQA